VGRNIFSEKTAARKFYNNYFLQALSTVICDPMLARLLEDLKNQR